MSHIKHRFHVKCNITTVRKESERDMQGDRENESAYVCVSMKEKEREKERWPYFYLSQYAVKRNISTIYNSTEYVTPPSTHNFIRDNRTEMLKLMFILV